MTDFPWKRIQSSVAVLLIIVVVGGCIVVPPKKAEAVVPTNVDFSPKAIAEWILQTATAIKNLAQTTITAVNTNALVKKEYVLDPLAWIAKLVIRQLRDMVVQWILTGRFGGPTFSQSILLDLKNAAFNASKIFLSNLTGIIFCSGSPPLPPDAFLRLSLSARLNCSFAGGGTIADLLAASQFDYNLVISAQDVPNDYFNSAIAALDEKLIMESAARDALQQEYIAGRGFLGIRLKKQNSPVSFQLSHYLKFHIF